MRDDGVTRPAALALDPVRNSLVVDPERSRDRAIGLATVMQLYCPCAQGGRIPKPPILLDVVPLAILALVALVFIYCQSRFCLAIGTLTVRTHRHECVHFIDHLQVSIMAYTEQYG
jgi:hypothetical protein